MRLSPRVDVVEHDISRMIAPFDRVRARRVMLVLEESIKTVVSEYLLELNDSVTRNNVSGMVNLFLEGCKTRNAVNDYRVICDETNNTPDSNDLHMDVYVQPQAHVEFIQLTVTTKHEGISFGELEVIRKDPVPESFFRMD